MCKKAVCETCRKTGWVGCGKHVDEVMASVHPDSLCTCEHLIVNEDTNIRQPPRAGTGRLSKVTQRPTDLSLKLFAENKEKAAL